MAWIEREQRPSNIIRCTIYNMGIHFLVASSLDHEGTDTRVAQQIMAVQATGVKFPAGARHARRTRRAANHGCCFRLHIMYT